MDLFSLSLKLRLLELGERATVYMASEEISITATRTDKICPGDFSVGLIVPIKTEFNPTHVRLLFDLHLKRISNASSSRFLFSAFEKVFSGDDPDALAHSLVGLKFPLQLDLADVNLYYGQLLMLEQDFNYGPDGCRLTKYDPPRALLMSFIRWIASGEDEIDKVITAAVKGWEPRKRFQSPLDF